MPSLRLSDGSKEILFHRVTANGSSLPLFGSLLDDENYDQLKPEQQEVDVVNDKKRRHRQDQGNQGVINRRWAIASVVGTATAGSFHVTKVRRGSQNETLLEKAERKQKILFVVYF